MKKRKVSDILLVILIIVIIAFCGYLTVNFVVNNSTIDSDIEEISPSEIDNVDSEIDVYNPNVNDDIEIDEEDALDVQSQKKSWD